MSHTQGREEMKLADENFERCDTCEHPIGICGCGHIPAAPLVRSCGCFMSMFCVHDHGYYGKEINDALIAAERQQRIDDILAGKHSLPVIGHSLSVDLGSQ
jgi:hypothetical protein